MRSPFTGGSATKLFKDVTYTFRKEKYTVRRCYFRCDETGRTFTNAQVDDEAMADLYGQYRKRHGIPSPDELKNLRHKYGLSAHVMSKIAGIGVNQYGLYENGEMPTPVVGKALASLFDKNILLQQIDRARGRLDKDYDKVRNKVLAYMEPRVFDIRRDFYPQFDEAFPVQHGNISYPFRKARWATAGKTRKV